LTLYKRSAKIAGKEIDMKIVLSKELFDKMVAVILELPAKSVLGLVQEIQQGAQAIEEKAPEAPKLEEVKTEA
jgi:hypothetical protein